MKTRPLAGLGVMLLLGACGGSVSGGTRDEPGPEPDASDEQVQGDASDSSDDSSSADTELGSCKLGRPAYEDFAKPCAWVAEDRCYDTREMACNCACPRQGTSQCASGFDGGPNGRVWVSCD